MGENFNPLKITFPGICGCCGIFFRTEERGPLPASSPFASLRAAVASRGRSQHAARSASLKNCSNKIPAAAADSHQCMRWGRGGRVCFLGSLRRFVRKWRRAERQKCQGLGVPGIFNSANPIFPNRSTSRRAKHTLSPRARSFYFANL
jgi:hypothetical protein